MNTGVKFDALKLLYKVNVFTSGLPQYSFESGKPIETSWQLYYIAFVDAIVFAGFCYSIHGRSAFANLEFGVLICDDFANVSLTICTVVNAILLYRSGVEYSDKLLNLFYSYDLNRNEGCVWLITATLGVAAVVCYNAFVMSFPVTVVQYYIFNYFQYLAVVAQILLMNCMLNRIGHALVLIRNDLIENINGFMVLPIAEMYESGRGLFTLTGWSKSILETKADMKDVAKIKKVARDYKDIYLMTHYFNLIFGWPIMFILAMVLFEVIMMMDAVVHLFMEKEDTKAWFLALKISTAIYFYICEVSIVLSCEDVVEKTDEFANETYKQILVLCESQESISEQMILKELMALWYHITNNKPKFQAGFVVLRKKFIYGSFIAVTSFIAVIVEFNRFLNDDHHLSKVDGGGGNLERGEK